MANPNKIQLDLSCRWCKEKFPVFTVTYNEYSAWAELGRRIQDAMPGLTPDQREMLISGTCPKCWDNMFGKEMDEEIEIDDREEDEDTSYMFN